MPTDVDQSLLDRLQALRGLGQDTTPERSAPVRTRQDSREDTLAARLKSLRARDDALPQTSSKAHDITPQTVSASKSTLTPPRPGKPDDDDLDALFQTDMQTLEEMIGNLDVEGEPASHEPSVEQVTALLDQLSGSVPQDDTGPEREPGDSDDSEGEHMAHEVDSVLARFRDEMQLEASVENSNDDDEQGKHDEEVQLSLPSLPSNLDDLGPTTTTPRPPRAIGADVDDITARLAALRAPDSDSLNLPSVPNSKPSGQPVNRLTSRTDYTDDDADGWCTVCLEDATLQCKGCDDDVYCSRCWREMHIGPSAGFDERSHKAVHFIKAKKDKEGKIAMGA